jgi:hypothetical protein
METLDLHGVRHKEAQLLVEEFVLLEDLPEKSSKRLQRHTI